MKAKTIFQIITLGLILGSNVSAQNKWRDVQANSLDIYFGGDIGYRLIDDLNNPDNGAFYNREEKEYYKANKKFGINYNLGLSKRFLLKIGLRYSNPGYSISRTKEIDFADDINTIKKIHNYNGFKYKVQYNLIGIPLGLKYFLPTSSCDPYIEFGFIPSLYLNTKVIQSDITGQSSIFRHSEKINRFNLYSFFGVGGNFNIANNIDGFTQLTGYYQLNNLRQFEIAERLVNLGIEFGTRFYF